MVENGKQCEYIREDEKNKPNISTNNNKAINSKELFMLLLILITFLAIYVDRQQ